jgi:Rrf2 family nitric oxide-sensitive transcriptional repressor
MIVHVRRFDVLTQTSLTAMRALLVLATRSDLEPTRPRQLAEVLHESPTYLAKVTGLLVKAGILRAHRGVNGGVVMQRTPAAITLRSVVEACQGAIVGDFCQATSDLGNVCAFHQAAAELHDAIVGVLERWTLLDLVKRPGPLAPLGGEVQCRLVVGSLRAGRRSRTMTPPSSNTPPFDPVI